MRPCGGIARPARPRYLRADANDHHRHRPRPARRAPAPAPQRRLAERQKRQSCPPSKFSARTTRTPGREAPPSGPACFWLAPAGSAKSIHSHEQLEALESRHSRPGRPVACRPGQGPAKTPPARGWLAPRRPSFQVLPVGIASRGILTQAGMAPGASLRRRPPPPAAGAAASASRFSRWATVTRMWCNWRRLLGKPASERSPGCRRASSKQLACHCRRGTIRPAMTLPG